MKSIGKVRIDKIRTDLSLISRILSDNLGVKPNMSGVHDTIIEVEALN